MWKRWHSLLFSFIGFSLLAAGCDSLIAAASEKPAEDWRGCFDAAGRYYGIAPSLLIAIAEQESQFNPHARNRNADGSVDVGLMQINSSWFPTLRSMGIEIAALDEPCTSIFIGGWVLAQSIARVGYTWEAIGEYNAGPRKTEAAARRRAAYSAQVSRRLFRADDARAPLRLRGDAAGAGIAEYSLVAEVRGDSDAGHDGGQ